MTLVTLAICITPSTETGCGRDAKQNISAKLNSFGTKLFLSFLLRKCIPTLDVFIHKQRSYRHPKFWSKTAELQRKLMEKAEVIQKLIFFTSEISLLIFFSRESITFWNMHVISSLFSCISLVYIYYDALYYICIFLIRHKMTVLRRWSRCCSCSV